MKKKDIAAHVNHLIERLDDQQRELQRLKRVLEHTQARMTSHAEHESKARRHIVAGLGGLQWKSQAGHSRFIIALSDSHLNNLLQYSGCEGEAREMVQEELRRREIDRQFRLSELATQRSVARGIKQAKAGKLRKSPSKRKTVRRAKKA